MRKPFKVHIFVMRIFMSWSRLSPETGVSFENSQCASVKKPKKPRSVHEASLWVGAAKLGLPKATISRGHGSRFDHC